MVDVCPSHDDRLTGAAHRCLADVAAARALAPSASTTATEGGGCAVADIAAEV